MRTLALIPVLLFVTFGTVHTSRGDKRPILHKVTVSHDVIFNRFIKWNPQGYHISFEFVRKKGDDSSYQRMYASIPTNLGPPLHGEWRQIVKEYTRDDRLGEVSVRGGSESIDGPHSIHVFLTNKGAPRWRTEEDVPPAPLVAYSVGDLKSLPSSGVALSVDSQEIYDDDLVPLRRFSNLQSLDIGQCEGVTDKGLQHLSMLKDLKRLTLAGEVLTGTGFKHLNKLGNLTHVTLYSSGCLTDRGIAEIAKMKQLTTLDLNWAAELTDSQLESLSNLKELRGLSIGGSRQITDKGLAHVAKIHQLEQLSFGHSKAITPKGISHLST